MSNYTKIIIIGIIGLGLIILGMIFHVEEALAKILPIEQLPTTEPERTNASAINVYTRDRAALDLQNQIDQLNNKNVELERKLNSKTNTASSQPLPQTVISASDGILDQKIQGLETRVSIVESLMNSLKNMLTKTLNLLEKVLKLF